MAFRKIGGAIDWVPTCGLYISWNLNESIISVVYPHNDMCTYLVVSNIMSFLGNFSRTNRRFDVCGAFAIRLIYCR